MFLAFFDEINNANVLVDSSELVSIIPARDWEKNSFFVQIMTLNKCYITKTRFANYAYAKKAVNNFFRSLSTGKSYGVGKYHGEEIICFNLDNEITGFEH